MAELTRKEAYGRWRQWCDTVRAKTSVKSAETPSERNERIRRLRSDYGAFVDYYFPHYVADSKTGEHTASAPFHISAANKIRRSPNIRAAFKWARGHAKSTHFDIMIPMWLKCQEPRDINLMALIGKSQDNANTLLGDLQAELQFNQRYIDDFGQQYNAGNWTNGQFVTLDGCAFFARGRGQTPRGLRYRSNRPDYIVIDDLDDDELVQNEERVGRLTQWVKEALFGALDGGRGRFVMVGNLIGKKSVLAAICQTDSVEVSQVNAFDRQGRVSWGAKWTPEELRSMERFMGYRAFQKEMMNNPITEGAVFRQDWIKWKKMLPLSRYDRIVAYCDPSFKSGVKNDYKAIKVWGLSGVELHHIDAFVRQCSVAEMVRWFYNLHERMKSEAMCQYYIEANFLQDIILDEFTREGRARGYQLPIRADRRKKPDKFQRIEGISPLWERGFVYYNEAKQHDPDMLAGLDQTLAFEKGSAGHDDAPDADEGAIYIIQQHTRIANFEPRIGRRKTSKNIW
jgi:predicted phage terminase large subunit-like protein